MPTTTVPDPVNTTAVDFLNRAEGKIQVAHWYLTAYTERDTAQALADINLAIADLESAKAAITTGEARELRRPVDVSPAHEVVDL